MSDSNKIEVGDMVQVNMDAAGMNFIRGDAEVLHVPQATGDSWHFKTSEGVIIYTNEPITIYLRSKAEDKPGFDMVSCSQCGCGFGPGEHGYSHCHDHQGQKVIED